MGTALLQEKDGWLVVRTPYQPEFVFDLKAAIRYQDRQWRPNERVWAVDLAYLSEVKAICDRYFDKVIVQYDKASPPPSGYNGKGDHYRAMLEVLPEAVLRKIYKLAIASVHPDVGGDTRTAQQVNIAWDAICRERKIS